MTNQTMTGLCPSPFLQETLFPSHGGFIDGRFCQAISTTHGNVSCCLPCPLAAWTYGDELISQTKVASWLGVAVLPLCIFLLVSYAVLPAKWTHRHYLSICFTLGILFMEVAFIIPLGVEPKQCYNQITPNDMHTDLSCAFTGSMLLFGGWVTVVFSFIRTLAFHLQVCWEVVLGQKFMWAALVLGWGIPVIGLAVMLILTGVSYRFGTVCHINIHESNHDYWAPVMAFAVVALILQLVTMAYCIYIYVKSVFDQAATTNSSGIPSYSSSVKTMTARQAYRRVRRVLQLQWRGVSLVLIIIGNVIFFAVVFINMDNQLAPTTANADRAAPWLACLVLTQGERKECLTFAKSIVPNRATLLAVLILLALVGFWNFVLFARPSIFIGWAEFFKSRMGKPSEFVSVDARRTPDSRAYEMLSNNGGLPPYNMKEPEPIVRTPSAARTLGTKTPDGGYGREARYVRPSMSFSSPQPPPNVSQGAAREWDPEATFARGHSSSGSQ
ncbi:hypothetical protein BO70DRAFT_367979 [Aspergillus heteromorphus CBS 117.55]|uniref:G-protein coupled receptors family 2 profile 2 domain-containing protein n=1 Tax=Aspergillus heteromorphus CBS 117.55 TaxID=1448321 RepID=A0A317WXJ2_9EURO|nr:uncharacterized protein BO70DRAFT_367979 [Aspergillus heteromorphus CBS 117.55]PWY90735.1 hypothetical protein BO70DRAFT_367979 [Aspergillus heteromorphus CBS 117.55]